MTRIIAPHEFKSTPWKNGMGHTLELAISDGGTVADFDWRLSIAQVVVDGPFSDFSGYERNLFLLEGNGIDLEHDQTTTDSLVELFDVARFDGSGVTVAKLKAGPITDFNLMTRNGKYRVRVETVSGRGHIQLADADHTFVFSPKNPASLPGWQDQSTMLLPAGHLLVLDDGEGAERQVEGSGLIVIELKETGS